MLGTLGKIALGIAAAKGAGNLLGRSSNSQSGGGLGDLLGGLLNGGGVSTSGAGSTSGGLGGLLGSLVGGTTSAQSAPTTSVHNQTTNPQGGNLSDMLNAAFDNLQQEAPESEEQKSKLLLRAMISAAKADGHIDDQEQAKITKHLDDITPEELEFVRKELTSPLDLNGLIDDTPSDMANEVYLMSLLAIDLDSQDEEQYLQDLAKGLNIDDEVVAKIHKQLGVGQ